MKLTAAGKHHHHLTYLISLLPSTGTDEQQRITGQGLTVKWRPTETKPVAEPRPGSHQSAHGCIHSGTHHFNNTVVIPWILMLFLKKHFHIFQYITVGFWYIVPDWLCVASVTMKVHDCHSILPLKKKKGNPLLFQCHHFPLSPSFPLIILHLF